MYKRMKERKKERRGKMETVRWLRYKEETVIKRERKSERERYSSTALKEAFFGGKNSCADLHIIHVSRF
jgi:hypothetical protein